jgi:ATP-dependent Clp protease ATP-binding subunit ClpA
MVPVFEHFNEHARRVVVLAREEAVRGDHDQIGADHIFLGVLAQEDGAGYRLLERLEVPVADLCDLVRDRAGRGPGSPNHLPFSPQAKKALELSLRVAVRLDDRYIGSEHVLLGVLRESSSHGARALLERGIGVVEAAECLGDIEREAPLNDEPLRGRWWHRRRR